MEFELSERDQQLANISGIISRRPFPARNEERLLSFCFDTSKISSNNRFVAMGG
jgi:hypothetical protein